MIVRKTDTQDSVEYWKHIDKIAERVRNWPKWMGGEANYSDLMRLEWMLDHGDILEADGHPTNREQLDEMIDKYFKRSK